MFVACLSGFTLTLAAQPTGGNNLKRHLIVQLQKENQNN